MAITPDDLKIINRALVLVGEEPLKSTIETEQTGEGASDSPAVATVALTSYEQVVKFCYAFSRWNFARDFIQLNMLDPSKVQPGMAEAYGIPSAAHAIHRVVDKDGREIPYDRTATTIQISEAYAGKVWMIYGTPVEPSRWPAMFTEAVIALLCAKFAIGLMENAGLASQFQAEGMRAVQLAASKDAQEATPKRLKLDLFTKSYRTNRSQFERLPE